MEEADLLKERLQAITDKRRIQENINMKRRQIEEEKLKLQYIKKKALREQWLMDGLSQQSEEEQAAMKLQAQGEQQQSDELKSNILRIEKEIEALETEELNISANEEVILKRLKEVERTTEDIIKEINAEFHADLTYHATSPLPDFPPFIPHVPSKSPLPETDSDKPKKATFALEISVEHDKRTGKSQVVSTAMITPETIQDRGLKVYDDGRKSVYALNTDEGKMISEAVGEMTSKDVEELLDQAADKNVPTDVQYHQPVYSVPYTGNSRPSTPRTPNKAQRLTPSPSLFHNTVSSRNGAPVLQEEQERCKVADERRSPSKTPSPSFAQKDFLSRNLKRPGEDGKLPCFKNQEQSNYLDSPSNFSAETPQGLTKSKASSSNPATLVSVKAKSEEMPERIQPVYLAVDNGRLSVDFDPHAFRESPGDMNRYSPYSSESTPSLNPVSTLPEELDSEPITMIFMGYENADEEEEDIQAELVIISNSDDDDDENHNVRNESDEEECLSYHPEGYKSKVFQPKVGIAKVADCRDTIADAYTNQDDSGLHKPTFTHKPGKQSPYLQGQSVDGSANAGSINMEKMKLCSTGR